MRLRVLLPLLVAIALLVPAVLLTVARLVEPAGGRWVRMVAFLPWAVVLYAAAALVLLLVAALARGRARHLALVTAVVALVPLSLHAWWVSPAWTGEGAAPAPGSAFTVMTLNLRYGEADPDRVANLVDQGGVDVLVLQEATPESVTGLAAAGVRFAHEAGEAAPGVTGTVVLSRLPLSDAVRLEMRLGGWSTTVESPSGPVDLLAVHPSPPVGSAASWSQDLERVVAAARDLDGPALVVGDLNATTDHAPLRELEQLGYRDAVEVAGAGWQPTWPSDDGQRPLARWMPPAVAIDHVLVGEGLAAVDPATATVAGTDHRALRVTVGEP